MKTLHSLAVCGCIWAMWVNESLGAMLIYLSLATLNLYFLLRRYVNENTTD